MNFKPADIIITREKSNLLSNSIIAVLRFFQSDPVEYQHSMLVANQDTCIEANLKIEMSILADRFEDLKKYKVLRHNNLTDEQREAIVNRAKTLLGKRYSFGRLFLQLLDQIFSTNYFTRRVKDPDQQICSSLIAWCYGRETGIKFNNLNWSAVEPDDIDDESLKNNTPFETILEWEI